MKNVNIIAFTGGRTYFNVSLVHSILDICIALNKEITYRIGCCPTGLDAIVRNYLRLHTEDKNIQVYKADWTIGLKAGPMRNANMLLGRGKANILADLLIAFPGGKGTNSCIGIAKRNDIKVIQC